MSNTKIVLHNLKNVIRRSKTRTTKDGNTKTTELYDGTMEDIYEQFKKVKIDNIDENEYQQLNSDTSSDKEDDNLINESISESESSYSFSDSSLSD